jgi:hypothetical protein
MGGAERSLTAHLNFAHEKEKEKEKEVFKPQTVKRHSPTF